MQTKVQFENDSKSTTRNENLKCWNLGANPLCLRIELADGTEFMLPYGYFEGAKYVRGGDGEILHLHFKAHEFSVKGNALSELFAAFQTLSVEWIKECPRRYRPVAQKDKAFIETIEMIQPAGEPLD
jgi:hypothetical protein